MSALHTLLNVDSSAALLLDHVEWLNWGQSLVFSLRGGEAAQFELHFDDCREIRWRTYAHETKAQATPIVDFAPGRDGHRSPANLLTEHFALTLWYGSMTVLPAPKPV